MGCARVARVPTRDIAAVVFGVPFCVRNNGLGYERREEVDDSPQITKAKPKIAIRFSFMPAHKDQKSDHSAAGNPSPFRGRKRRRAMPRGRRR